MSSPTNYQQKLTGIAKIESNIHIRARRALTDRDVAFQTKSTGVTPPDPERWGVYIIRPILRKQRPKYDYRCRVNAELQSIFGLKRLTGRHSFEFDLKRRTGKRVRLNKQLLINLRKLTAQELDRINYEIEKCMGIKILQN
jgi:hypothetical protein